MKREYAKESAIETIEKYGVVIYVLSRKDPFIIAAAYKGKRTKPSWYYRFLSQKQFDEHVEQFLESEKKEFELKQRIEAINIKDLVTVGDIYSASWGYEQTNVDYYQVIEVTEKSVKLQEVEKEYQGNEAHSMTGYSVPLPGKFTGKAFRRKVLKTTRYFGKDENEDQAYFKIDSYKYAYKLQKTEIIKGVFVYEKSLETHYA